MPVLAFDTSTRLQSIAIASGGRVVASIRLEIASSHAETLVRGIDLALDAARLRAADLGAIAVTTGPGSFTGLRIGLATAKGLGLASGVPIAGLSTLRALAEALAETLPAEAGLTVAAILDAGRGQVYRGLFRSLPGPGDPWRAAPCGPEEILEPAGALDGLEAGGVAGGDGAARFRDRWPRLPSGARILDENLALAPILALRAEAIAARGGLGGLAPVPNYIRPPDALRGGPA